MKFNKLIVLNIIYMLLLICISVALLIIKGVGAASLIFIFIIIISLLIYLIRDIFKIKKFINNYENNYLSIENEINYSGEKFYNFYATDKYLFMMDDFKKVYYSDVVVAEASPALLSGTKGKTFGYKYKLYLKNKDIIICKFHLVDGNYEKFTKLLKEKNSKIFFGIYEDYKNSKASWYDALFD